MRPSQTVCDCAACVEAATEAEFQRRCADLLTRPPLIDYAVAVEYARRMGEGAARYVDELLAAVLRDG